MPTDGIYAAETNTALIYALQAEEGLSTSVANGSFGPTTTTDCPTLSPGDSRTNFVYILQYALYCNGYNPGAFNGVYGSSVTSAVENYQSFTSLPVTGISNMPTIKALMASCGDTSRSASACDCATILTATTAATLKNNGYQYVGGYLTGTVGSGVSKALTAAEIQIIFNAGLKFFPIYESHGTSNDYFTSSQGCYDAYAAIEAAENLGIPAGSIIYFAVDYDAMDSQVTSIGAHILQVNALNVKGSQDLSIDLSYNSAKLSLGTMGKGWSHNNEIKISKVYSSLFVYWTRQDYSVFTQNGSGNYTCTDLASRTMS